MHGVTDVEFIVRDLGFDSPSLTNCAQDLRNDGIHAFCHPPLRRHAAVPLSFRRQVSRCPEGHIALNLPSLFGGIPYVPTRRTRSLHVPFQSG